MLKNLRNDLSVTKDWYNSYKKQIKLISNISVKDKQLYDEFEKACRKQYGILTYAEYLTIDQFGNHGYYATNDSHGKTDIDERWGLALSKILPKKST